MAGARPMFNDESPAFYRPATTFFSQKPQPPRRPRSTRSPPSPIRHRCVSQSSLARSASPRSPLRERASAQEGERRIRPCPKPLCRRSRRSRTPAMALPTRRASIFTLGVNADDNSSTRKRPRAAKLYQILTSPRERRSRSCSRRADFQLSPKGERLCSQEGALSA